MLYDSVSARNGGEPLNLKGFNGFFVFLAAHLAPQLVKPILSVERGKRCRSIRAHIAGTADERLLVIVVPGVKRQLTSAPDELRTDAPGSSRNVRPLRVAAIG